MYRNRCSCSTCPTDTTTTEDTVIIQDTTTQSDITTADCFPCDEYVPTVSNGCTNTTCNCAGIPTCANEEGVLLTDLRELCCDPNGYCALYPSSCRNKYWPAFSRPRWLACEDLYCLDTNNTYC